MCSDCQMGKKKKIGALSSADKKELVEGAWIAAGAVGSKMIVNPLAKAIFGDKQTKNSPGIAKLLIAAALWYADTEETRAMAKGAGAVGILDLLDKNYPKIFQSFLPKGEAAPSNPSLPKPAATKGIYGSVILDLDNIEGIGDDYEGIGYAEDMSSSAQVEMGRGAMW